MLDWLILEEDAYKKISSQGRVITSRFQGSKVSNDCDLGWQH